MNILIYLIKTVLVSGFLLGYYELFLKNRSFHGFNRVFLLSAPLVGFLLPALHLGLPGFWNHSASPSPIRILSVGRGTLEEAVTIYATQKSGIALSWEFIGMLTVILVCCFLLIRFARALRFIQNLRKNNPFILLPEATVYFVSAEGTPFSFFRSIFWRKEMDLNSPEGKQILRHELFHVKNHHSLDILLMEIFSILYWFNPFIHFIRRELQAIHEYAADEYAAQETGGYQYASLLLMKISGSPLSITNPFFKNLIKRRIAMIAKSQKKKKALLGRFMILPMILFLVCLFSFKMQNSLHSLSAKPIRVVIDAGHGGSFNGAVYQGVLEKNINLLIAKKIQSLSGQYNVDVIMSRETDVTPGSNELRESLEYIAALPKNKNADLFISIHTNATDDALKGNPQNLKSGFQIYIPRNSSEVYESSLKFGSIMTDVIKSDYSIESELRQTRGDGGNILILKKATVPALLIECGYMDNASDLKYLLDDKNQEKIARDILEGIRQYSAENMKTATLENSKNSVPGDTLSFEDMNRLNPIDLDSLHVSKNLITLTEKNGKKYYVVITKEMRAKYDSIRKATNDTDKIFTQVEVEAEYPGGQNAWINYLIKNMKYPEAAIKNEIQGEVRVEFIVKKNGTLTNIRAISGPEALKQASINIIRASGKWIPAKQKGIVVESSHVQPINFKLQQG